MVNQTTQSLLAKYLDTEDHEFAATSSARLMNPHREQKSAARLATESRYSRRRSPKATVPRGPRRRQRQPNGL